MPFLCFERSSNCSNCSNCRRLDSVNSRKIYIVPPHNLYHPVLEHKKPDNGRLIYDLKPRIGTWSTRLFN